MQDNDKKGKRIVRVEMEAQNLPCFKPKRNGDYIMYGENNDYPNYLIDLYQRSAEHNAILRAKSSYVFGKGLSFIKTNDAKADAKLQAFVDNANQYESWNKLLQKTISNFELIDGYYWQIIFGRNGKPSSVYQLDTTRIRRSEDLKGFWYCEDWADRRKVEEKKYYPAYNENIKTGSCIFYRKMHSPALSRFADVYSIPNYIGALSAIETDVNVDVFFNSLTDNGMFAQGMLTLFNGIPTVEEEVEIVRNFKKKATGAKKAGEFLLNFADNDGKEALITNFATSDLDKQFEILSKRVLQKICSGHRIDPVLIGIDTATSWSRPQLLDKWERFQTEYVNPRQEIILEDVKMIASLQGLMADQLIIEDLSPLGEEIDLGENTFNEVMTIEEKRNYLRDKKGVQLSSMDDDSSTSRLSLAQKLGVGGSTALQQLIIDTTVLPETKLNILMGLYSIPEKKARKMLGLITAPQVDAEGNPIAMSAVSDKILEAFKARARKDNDDEVLEVMFLQGDPKEFEAKQAFKFADILGGTVKEVRNQILDLLAGDPFIKPELIAKQLGTDVDYVNEQISQMQEAKILETDGKSFTITEKGLRRAENVEPVIESEIYTVYQYAKRPDIKGEAIMSTTREFCKDLMELSEKKHIWTREDIDGITNEFGDNAWVYRGGFYNDGKETTPYCRHLWKAITKTRRKNG